MDTSNQPKIILVADDPAQRNLLRGQFPARCGFSITAVSNLGEVHRELPVGRKALVVLRASRPHDFSEELTQWRAQCPVPLLVVTDADSLPAWTNLSDFRIDHCLVEPYAPGELAQRAGTQLASWQPAASTLLLGEITVDLNRRTVIRGQTEEQLTQMEHKLLLYLVNNPDRPIERGELLQRVWSYRPGVVSRAVDYTVKRLRNKIEPDPAEPSVLVTVHRVGYRFVPPSTPAPAPEPLVPRPSAGLPKPSTRYFGRQDLLRSLEEAILEGTRLLTLLGPGGMGKTRLSLELSQTVARQERFFLFCDLSAATTEDELLEAIARGVGAGHQVGVPLLETIATSLGGMGEGIVTLDNFEHLARYAPLVGALLQATPEVTILVTSRVRLRLQEERTFVVPSLSTEAAHALFLDRARTARRNFGEDVADMASIDALLAHLDGLPLAIELAAARCRTMSATQILARMDRRFQLLRSTDRDTNDRHRTLLSTLEGSWELLDNWQRSALLELSVFRAPFTLEAAEAVVDLGDDPEAPWISEVLEHLCDHSFVHLAASEDGEVRFALYCAVREFALAKAGGAHSDNLARRHAAFHASWGDEARLESMETSAGLGARQQLTACLPDLLAAVDWARAAPAPALAARACLAAHKALRNLGQSATLIPRLQSVVTCETMADTDLVRLLAILSTIHRRRGEQGEAARHIEHAVEVATRCGDDLALSNALTIQAHLWRRQAQHGRAEPVYLRAIEAAQRAGASRSEIYARSGYANLLQETGRAEEARGKLEAVISMAVAHDYVAAEAITRGNLANLLKAQGDIAGALRHYELSLDKHWQANDRHETSVGVGNLANLLADLGRYEEAIGHYVRGIAILKQLGNLPQVGLQTSNLASVYAEQGDLQRAERLCLDAIEIHRAAGSTSFLIFSLEQLLNIQCHQGMSEQAARTGDEALRIARAGPSPRPLLGILNLLGLNEVYRGNLTAAARYLDEASEVLTRCRDLYRECMHWQSRAYLYRAQTDADQFEAAVERAEALCAQIGPAESSWLYQTIAGLRSEITRGERPLPG